MYLLSSGLLQPVFLVRPLYKWISLKPLKPFVFTDPFLLTKPLAICFSSCVWTCRSRSWSWRMAYGVTGNSRGPNSRICHVGLNVGWASVLLFWALASFCLQCFDWGFSHELLSSHPWSEDGIDSWSKLSKYRICLETYWGAYLDGIFLVCRCVWTFKYTSDAWKCILDSRSYLVLRNGCHILYITLVGKFPQIKGSDENH